LRDLTGIPHEIAGEALGHRIYYMDPGINRIGKRPPP
jgi:hypothetical protein